MAGVGVAYEMVWAVVEMVVAVLAVTSGSGWAAAGRGSGQGDNVRHGVLLVPLCGRRHLSCFFVPVIMQRQVLAVLMQFPRGFSSL